MVDEKWCQPWCFPLSIFTGSCFISAIPLCLQQVRSVCESWGSGLCSLLTGWGCHGDLKRRDGGGGANSSFRQRFTVILDTDPTTGVVIFYRLVRVSASACLFVLFLRVNLFFEESYKDGKRKREKQILQSSSLVWRNSPGLMRS